MQGVQEEAPVVNQYIVEKIMGSREGTRELEPDEEVTEASKDETEKEKEETTAESGEGNDSKSKDKPNDKPPQTIKVTEYYVKYKNL